MTVTFRSLDQLANREPLAFDERARRVMELRRQVSDGTYCPDHRKIARAILEEWIAAGDAVQLEQSSPKVETAADRQEAAARFVVGRTSEHSGADTASASA